MIKQIFHFFSYPIGFALFLFVAGLAFGADVYYLKDDGSRWTSVDGEPIKGIHKSSLFICKQDGPCLDLMYAEFDKGAWRQRSSMWQEINTARQKLEESESDRVDLDLDTGRNLYNRAEIGSRQSFR